MALSYAEAKHRFALKLRAAVDTPTLDKCVLPEGISACIAYLAAVAKPFALLEGVAVRHLTKMFTRDCPVRGAVHVVPEVQ